jgi:predicted nicotinamide N-methyase
MTTIFKKFLEQIQNLSYQNHKSHWIVYDCTRPLIQFETDQSIVRWLISLSVEDQPKDVYEKAEKQGVSIQDVALIKDQLNQTSEETLENFGNYWIQWAFICDDERNKSFLTALKRHIQPNKSQILDLGTGSGLWSSMALHLEAKKVVAIDASFPKSLTKAILNQTNPSQTHKLHLKQVHSSTVKFSEKFDILIAELVGNRLLNEGLVPSLDDLFSRHPSLRESLCIPSRVELMAQMFHCLEDSLVPERFHYYWSRDFFDRNFSNFAETFQKKTFPKYPQIETRLPPACLESLSEPFSFLSISLNTLKLKNFRKKLIKKTFQVQRTSDRPLLIFWLQLYVPDADMISNHPTHSKAAHWLPIVCPLLPVSKDEKKTFSLVINEDATDFDLI